MDISVFVIEILSQLFIWIVLHGESFFTMAFLGLLFWAFYRST